WPRRVASYGKQERPRSTRATPAPDRQAELVVLQPSVDQDKVLALDVSELPQSVLASIDVRVWPANPRQKTNADEPTRLLRPRCERPCRSRAAEQRDELAPSHSITSS